MFTVRRIDSFDLPELRPYRTMRRQLEQRDEGIFVAEGEKVVRRLIDSVFSIVSVLSPENWLKELEPLLEARPEKITVFVAEKKLLETLTGFSMYQGLLAVGRIPPQPTLASLIERTDAPRLLAAVDGLTNAENLGALVRNCAAFGVHGLIIGETCCSPFLRRAVRSSMGTIFQMPVIESQRLVATLNETKARGLRCIAAHPHVQGKSLPQIELAGDCCIIFGSEGSGIARDVLEICDDAVAIPMSRAVDSLNVASAAAVFLYEASRQRKSDSGMSFGTR